MAAHEGSPQDVHDLQAFVLQLGAALSAAGEPAYSVQERLVHIAGAYGVRAARISAFPTYLMVTMGVGEPTALELSTAMAPAPRLDQIAALDRLLDAAQRGEVAPTDGLRQLEEIGRLPPRFRPLPAVLGYAVLSAGLCLLLRPAPVDVVAAAAFGGLVGLLRSIRRPPPQVQVLMPVLAALCVSATSALAVELDVTGPGIRAVVASLVVFLPGATLTTAVLELTAGQVVSGSSRLVAGAMQVALLSFGILAGIELVGTPAAVVLAGSDRVLPPWTLWLGVLLFAIGVSVANSAPRRSFPGLLLVLYAAWVGQLVGSELVGPYLSTMVGAVVMTPVAYAVSRLPSGMPQLASFLPGFWLLVPGALGLIGFTELASAGSSAGTKDLVATVVSIFAVAIGVLVGSLLAAGVSGSRQLFDRAVGHLGTAPWVRMRGPVSLARGDDRQGPSADDRP